MHDSITATGIRKSFGPKVVLDGVNLTILPGQIVALVGPSGAGKSVLMRAASTLESPDEGRVIVDGTSYDFPKRGGYAPPSPFPKLTAVFQQLFLFPHMTIRKNIACPLSQPNSSETNDHVQHLIEMLQMEEYADRFPNEVSLGERQRAAFARALALRPKYLFLDEVTSALDVEHVGIVMNHLKELRDSGVGIMLITHFIGFARRAADHVLFMDHGRILEEGTADILAHPQSDRLQEFLELIEIVM